MKFCNKNRSCTYKVMFGKDTGKYMYNSILYNLPCKGEKQ